MKETVEELLDRFLHPEHLSYLVPLEQMGNEWGMKKQLFLKHEFMSKYLHAWEGDARIDPISNVTNVICPYCKMGFLVLITVKPGYSGGLGRAPMTLHHTHNDYEYRCSNLDCKAVFLGHYQWMWID